MLSPPSSPSVLASTSRHNILRPRSTEQEQKTLRLFLGHDSDEYDDDDDQDENIPYGTTHLDQRFKNQLDSEEEGEDRGSLSSSPLHLKRARACPSPKKRGTGVGASVNPSTPTKRQKGFLIRGNVTPSRAFSIFKAAKQRKQHEQEACHHGLLTPPISSPLQSIDFLHRSVEASPSKRAYRSQSPQSPSLPGSSRSTRSSIVSSTSQSPTKLQRSLGESAFPPFGSRRTSAFASSDAMNPNIRSLSSGALYLNQRSTSFRPLVDTSSFSETFVSPSSARYQLPSDRHEGSCSHPISAAYSYSSRSVNPSAQWLAVGDDEGRITLLNTLPAQDSAAETFPTNPSWQVTPDAAAVFELTWRFDDRAILSGSSDYVIRSWDTEYQKCTGMFEGHRGSPRTITYDPTNNGDGGCGNIFASAGRDGSIRIWDARSAARAAIETLDGQDLPAQSPVLTIESAHAVQVKAASRRGPKRVISKAGGVTALAYPPDGNGHKLLSGGSQNAIVKCWDLRHVRTSTSSSAEVELVMEEQQHRKHSESTASWCTSDLSLTPSTQLCRPHGLSQILTSSTHLYASCTGGKIYRLPLSSFLDHSQDSTETFYDPAQCQNTLFSRMSLFNDQFLAVACNTGDIALWDVRNRASSHSKGGDDGHEDESRDLEEERLLAKDHDMGIAVKSRHTNAVLLQAGHARNTEVNSVAWANGPNGPTLSSVGDDTQIRSWYPDRAMRDHIIQLAQE